MGKVVEFGKNHPFISIFVAVLAIFATVGTPIYLGYLGGIRETAAWRKGIDKDIEHIKGGMKTHTEQLQDLNSWKTSIGIKETQPSKEEEASPILIGTIGLINEKLAQKAKTRYGVTYFLDYNVCEINEFYDKWDKIGCVPYLGHFIEIVNAYNELRTWSMVIGSFNDRQNPNRLLLVSRKVANDLVFEQEQGILSVKIRLMDKTEWQINKDCLRLYKDVYKLEEQ